MPIDPKTLVGRADDLFTSSERYNNESTWDELTEFMLNNQHTLFRTVASSTTDLGNELSSARGAKQTRRVFDSTAMIAARDLAAAIQGTLTNPATMWSKLRFQDDELNNNDQAIKWLEDVNRVIHETLNESNFKGEIGKTYQSFVTLANGPMFLESDDTDGFRFTSLHLGQVVWTQDKDGKVDTVYRKFTMTAKQMVEKWEAKVHPDIMEALEKDPTKEFTILHCITPRKPEEVRLNDMGLAPGDKRPIASIYVDTSHHVTIEETGYYEMPVFIPRWGLMPGEVYGRGPGHLALPDTRTLNQVVHRSLQVLDRKIAPPILANQRDILGTLDVRPYGISVVRDVNGIREFTTQSNSQDVQISVEELKSSIRTIFYLDKLLLPPRNEIGEMTAFEVARRTEEMDRVLGPTLSRLNNELLNPLIVRCFRILLRANRLPPLPETLQGVDVNVEIIFVNQLARAQQVQDVSTIQQWVQGLGLIAQLDPSVIDNLDADGIARHTAKVLGVPEIAVANQDDIEQIRQQRAQQAQQTQALDSAVKAADVSSKLDTGGETGL